MKNKTNKLFGVAKAPDDEVIELSGVQVIATKNGLKVRPGEKLKLKDKISVEDGCIIRSRTIEPPVNDKVIGRVVNYISASTTISLRRLGGRSRWNHC